MEAQPTDLQNRLRRMQPRLSRRRLFATAATIGLAGLGIDTFAVEPARVTVSRHRLGDPSGGDTEHRPLRLVQLTDLHLRRLGRHAERVAETVTSLTPDVVLLTGDSIDRRENLSLLADFLGLLDRATPKFAILGNWEHWCGVDVTALGRVYDKSNGRLLFNESIVFTFENRELLITGRDDLIGGRPDFMAAVSRAAVCPNHLFK